MKYITTISAEVGLTMYLAVTCNKDEEKDGRMIRWDTRIFRTKFKGSHLMLSFELDIKDNDSDVY
jgi:hypothetical protein